MAKMTATPTGASGQPLIAYRAEIEISEDLPADTIGECVAEAVHKTWTAGLDPTKTPIVVTFS